MVFHGNPVRLVVGSGTAATRARMPDWPQHRMDKPVAELMRPLGAQQVVANDWGEPPSFPVSEQGRHRKPGESEVPVLVFPGKTEVFLDRRSGIHHMNVGFNLSFNVKGLIQAISEIVDAESDAQ